MTSIFLNEVETVFKLDTVAEVTAVSKPMYERLKGVKLQPTSRLLYGPTRQPLKVLGHFQATLARSQKATTQTVFVIDNLQTNLLVLPAISSLRLASTVDTCEHGADIMQRFPSLFHGLGTLQCVGKPYTIKLREGVQPHALFTPRNFPIPLRPKVQKELERMERLKVISRVTEPTPWCAGMVVVPKRSEDVFICVDLKPLIDGVLRETYPIPSVDDSLAQLAGATVFSKVDANSGFWQIPFSEDSRLLTTFITPFGRFCFNKLPFGISSAPEFYQRRMSQILAGLDGVLCHIDDVLIFGSTHAEHDAQLEAALPRLSAAGVTLSVEKCEYRMANQMGKFIPNLASLTQRLQELLSIKHAWLWSSEQEESFNRVKSELTQLIVLIPYHPQAPTKVSADASSHGLVAIHEP